MEPDDANSSHSEANGIYNKGTQVNQPAEGNGTYDSRSLARPSEKGQIAELRAELDLQKQKTAELYLALEKLTAQVNDVPARSSEPCRCGEKQELESIQDTMHTMKSDAEAFLVKLFAQYRSEVETIQIWVATELSNQLAEMRLQLTAERTKVGLEDTLLQLQRVGKKAQTRISELEARSQQEMAKNAANFEKIWTTLGASASQTQSRLVTQDDLELTTAKLITAHDELAESQDAIWDSLRLLFATQDRLRAHTESDLQLRFDELRRSLVEELAPRVVLHDGVHHLVTPLPSFMESSAQMAPSESTRSKGFDVGEIPRFPPEKSSLKAVLKPRGNGDSIAAPPKDVRRISPRKFPRNAKESAPSMSSNQPQEASLRSPPGSPKRDSLNAATSSNLNQQQKASLPKVIIHLPAAAKQSSKDSSVTPRKLFMREEDIDKFSPLVTTKPQENTIGNESLEIPPTLQIATEESNLLKKQDDDGKEVRSAQKRKTQLIVDETSSSMRTPVKNSHVSKPNHATPGSDSEPDRWEHEVVISEQFADATEGSCDEPSEKELPSANWSHPLPQTWAAGPANRSTLDSSPSLSSGQSLRSISSSASSPPHSSPIQRSLTLPLSHVNSANVNNSAPVLLKSISSPISRASTLPANRSLSSARPLNSRQFSTPPACSSSASSSVTTSAASAPLPTTSYRHAHNPSDATTAATIVTSIASQSPVRVTQPSQPIQTTPAIGSSSSFFTSSAGTMPFSSTSPTSIFSASLRSSSCHVGSSSFPQSTFTNLSIAPKKQTLDSVSLQPATFIKHAVGRGKPKSTLVSFISKGEGLGVIQWEGTQPGRPRFRNKPERCRELPIAEITEILEGKRTKALQRASSRYAIDENCFSLVSSNRTLDLEASTPELAKLWVTTISRLREQQQS